MRGRESGNNTGDSVKERSRLIVAHLGKFTRNGLQRIHEDNEILRVAIDELLMLVAFGSGFQSIQVHASKLPYSCLECKRDQPAAKLPARLSFS